MVLFIIDLKIATPASAISDQWSKSQGGKFIPGLPKYGLPLKTTRVGKQMVQLFNHFNIF